MYFTFITILPNYYILLPLYYYCLYYLVVLLSFILSSFPIVSAKH